MTTRQSDYVLLRAYLILCICASTIYNRDFTEADLKHYRQRVIRMFQHAYNGYLKYAYPYDELRPLTCDGHDTWGSYSLTLVDALDTLAIMGNYTEFQRVAKLLENTLNFDKDINVSVFETNIRVVGGLLSAHLMSRRAGAELEPSWPCSGPLLRMAEKVARKLLPAFNTSTGMPYGTVNLLHGVPQGETTVTCTAGVGTFLVEFGTLTRLTGDPVFENVAHRAMTSLWDSRSTIGLVGNHINVSNGKWTALDSGIGAGVDSYFEYLVKGAMLLNQPELMDRFYEHVSAIEQYLKREDWYMWAHMTKGTITLPVFQSLEAFWPGLQSLVGDVDKGMRTIHNYHQVWKQYGFIPEFYNIPKFETQSNREAYPLRPELIESAMYLYQATKDPFLLEVGVDMLESIEHSARTTCGYASVKDVRDHRLENRMESFFLAETTKYLYLLFDTDHFIHNTGDHGTVINTPNGECVIDAGGYVFNTEAHPVDGAALYCCSAEKKKDEAMIQQLHENVDLLSLLDLADSKHSPFNKNIDNPHIKKSHVRLKRGKPEPAGPPLTGNTFQQVTVTSPNVPDTKTKPQSSSNTAPVNQDLLTKLSQALKGNNIENLDGAVGDILRTFGSSFKVIKAGQSDGENTADSEKPATLKVESSNANTGRTRSIVQVDSASNTVNIVKQEVFSAPPSSEQKEEDDTIEVVTTEDGKVTEVTMAGDKVSGVTVIDGDKMTEVRVNGKDMELTVTENEVGDDAKVTGDVQGVNDPEVADKVKPKEFKAADEVTITDDLEEENDLEEDDEEVCTPEQEGQELWMTDATEAARQMLLLTCPSRPFSARYSVRGHFSPIS